MVFTFWEGRMPDYLKLCMKSWKFPYVVLNFENLNEYTELNVDKLKRFSLPQIADCVRVHVLRDQGGFWLDTDTIMLTDVLPDVTIMGDPVRGTNTIGFLHSKPHSEMFERWATYQDMTIEDQNSSMHWAVMGNMFTDPYLASHKVEIGDVRDKWPETYMVDAEHSNGDGRYEKYLKFYFASSFNLPDIRPTGMIMLHNSWTPDWYKKLSAKEVLEHNCTLSNFIRGIK